MNRLAVIFLLMVTTGLFGVNGQITPGKPQLSGMRQITKAQREAAAARRTKRNKAGKRHFAGLDAKKAQLNSPLVIQPGKMSLAPATLTPGAAPDYFNSANYANSPLPVINGSGISGGIRKFVDSLPGLGPSHANNLGNYIPLATATGALGGQPLDCGSLSDCYSIGLNDYQQQLHSDLPATRLRGYKDLAGPDGLNHYLGPLILARKNRPVRVLFTNNLPPMATTGKLFIPVDKTVMGNATGYGLDASGKQLQTPLQYSENRATLHLHGGNTPWISDGTPHQWTIPAGEDSSVYVAKGLSTRDVPDMAPTGQGQMSFYWTNQQSGRLMFFHDHSYGITRLNVYAGEAAGYLLVDPVEDALIASGAIPNNGGQEYNYGIPLIIQDKTFVPDTAGQLPVQDPTWDTSLWGGLGSLWLPHVYTPNQNPADSQGVNAFGRWDYGPWFWPPAPNIVYGPVPCPNNTTPGQTCPGTPNPTIVPEAFLDTPLVNGSAYPYLNVLPQAYRFRILNASNDRTLNLQLYIAEPLTLGIADGGTGYTNPTITITPAPGDPACAAATAAVDPSSGEITNVTLTATCKGFTAPPTITVTDPSAAASGAVIVASVNSEVPMIPAVKPSNMPFCPAGVLPSSSNRCWPQAYPTDSRDGGVPDPVSTGPAMIQIGTEGGFLPAPVVLPNTPIGYEYNRRSVTVLNVSNKTLMIGPAERADVIVDFSGVPAGSSVILFNDAPAPVPGFDSRYDYFTGDSDESSTGGAPMTMPGYGPNTRTIMQFRVQAGTPAPFDLTALRAQWKSIQLDATLAPGAFAQTQPAPLVPEAAYGATTTSCPNVLPINSNMISIAPPPAGCENAYSLTYPNNYARIQDTMITFTPLDKMGVPSASITLPMKPKAIQELFDPDYGRMNAQLGVEIPNTTITTQTTIPYYYVDPPTEMFKDGDTQVWKVTHNGVDTHAIHFHLFNVQLLNRVGWDGSIRPPDANELGWKETVRMNPLEDAIVALQPMKMTLPWALPNSVRPLDVTSAVGSTSMDFTNVNPDGTRVNITNQVTNFGWEYVWHCHLLGHEENDMMRPQILALPPAAPGNLSGGPSNGRINIQWTDPSAAGNGKPTTFTLQRATDPAFTTNLLTQSIAANSGQTAYNFLDTLIAGQTTYYYKVTASNVVGSSQITGTIPGTLSADSAAATLTFTPAPLAGIAPLTVSFGNQMVGATSPAQTLTLSNSGLAVLTINSIAVSGANAGDFKQTNSCGATLAVNATCTISVTFTPAAAGARSASLSIASNDTAHSPLTVAMNGTGIAPVAGLAPAALNFGTQVVNTAGTPKTATLSNTGTAPLVISKLVVGGTNAGDFLQTNNCPSSLAAGGTCSINITFRPAAAGARSAALSVTTNDPVNPVVTVTLSGTGSAVSVSPAALNFGSQAVNTSSAAQTVTLTNSGTAALTFSGVTINGANAGDFSSTNNCPATLAGGANCAIRVTFRPTAAGARAATLSIADSDPSSPQLVALSGTGTSVGVSVAPGSLSFSSPLNVQSAPQAVTVTNSGASPLTINSITITGTNSNQFALSNGCGSSLGAGLSCTVNVTFLPTQATPTAKSAVLNVNLAAPATSQTVTLSGTIATPTFTLVPAALTFSSPLNVTSAAQAVTMTNTGTAALAILSITVNGANANQFAQTNTCPASLAANATCLISVTFLPTAATPSVKSAGVIVNVAAATPQYFLLTGTVTAPVYTVAPPSLAFGNQARNTTSAAQVVTITNSAAAPLVISTITLTGANVNQFAQTSSGCIGTLPVNGSCTVSVTFSPTSTGAKSAALNVNVAAPGTSKAVPLSGTGI